MQPAAPGLAEKPAEKPPADEGGAARQGRMPSRCRAWVYRRYSASFAT